MSDVEVKVAVVTCVRMESTRFPGKCLASLAGKLLIQHTIDFARMLKLPLYVFTRSVEIMEYVSRQCLVVYEPIELYDTLRDSTYEKMQHVNGLLDADYVVNLQTTQPLRSLNLISAHLNRVITEHLHFTRVVTKKCVPFMDTGLMYTYSREHLIMKQERTDLFWPEYEPYFDIDTPEDLKACEEFLCRRS